MGQAVPGGVGEPVEKPVLGSDAPCAIVLADTHESVRMKMKMKLKVIDGRRLTLERQILNEIMQPWAYSEAQIAQRLAQLRQRGQLSAVATPLPPTAPVALRRSDVATD